MAITALSVTTFHATRQNFDWPSNADEQEAALAKAFDYQRAFYPVRETLTPIEEVTFNDAISLLALEMVTAPSVRLERALKKEKLTGASGASEEYEYEPAGDDMFPLITAMLAPLAPARASQSAAVRFARMRP